jgi:hypothetical protein
VLNLLLITLLTAAGLSTDTTVTIRFVPEVGSRHVIHLERVREEYVLEGERSILIDRLRHVGTIETEVRSARPGGHSVAWTYRQKGAPQRHEPHFDPLTGTLSDVTIVFTVDERGQPQRVLNPFFVRSKLAEAVEVARRHSDPRDGQRLDASIQQAETDSGLRALMLLDVERLHLPLARELHSEQEVQGQAHLKNPFGEGSIPASETFKLDSLSTTRDLAYFSWSLTPDPLVLAEIVLDLIDGFAPGAVELTPAELAERFQVHEQATFAVESATGLVREARFAKTVQTGGRTRSEVTTFVIRSPLEHSPPDSTHGRR